MNKVEEKQEQKLPNIFGVFSLTSHVYSQTTGEVCIILKILKKKKRRQVATFQNAASFTLTPSSRACQ